MGQVPPKSFLPPAPYGASPQSNTANPAQSAGVNPQTPLLPTGFTDPGTMGNQPYGTTNPTPAQGGMGLPYLLGGGRAFRP